jgi:hypothetical protein
LRGSARFSQKRTQGFLATQGRFSSLRDFFLPQRDGIVYYKVFFKF